MFCIICNENKDKIEPTTANGKCPICTDCVDKEIERRAKEKNEAASYHASDPTS